MPELKEIRLSRNLTQKQASDLLGVSLRSYITYEKSPDHHDSLKYRFLCESLGKIDTVDETHGILSIEEICSKCKTVFESFNVKYAILFGSYAKGKAKETSDIDIVISTDVTGLRFFGIAERLRQSLNKQVDLLDLKQLNNNPELLDEILKDGVKIYG